MGKTPRYVSLKNRREAELYGAGADIGDPWEIRGYAPDPTHVFDKTWRVATRPLQSVIGTVFAIGDRAMALVAKTTRRAIGATNSRTGEVLWLPYSRGRFGTDQLPVQTLPPYRGSAIQTADYPLARVLGHRHAAGLAVDPDQLIRARNGDPSYRPQKTGGFRLKLGT